MPFGRQALVPVNLVMWWQVLETGENGQPQMSVKEVWLVIGIPGCGNSTVARAPGSRTERSMHIEGDLLLDEWVVTGAVLTGEFSREESARQLRVCVEHPDKACRP